MRGFCAPLSRLDLEQPRDERGRWTDAGSGSTLLAAEGGEADISFIQSSFADLQFATLPSDYGNVLSDADPDPIIPGAQYAAANVVRNDRTGNPAIDKTTDRLIQTLSTVSETLGPGSGSYYGVVVHTEFARSVRARDYLGVGLEAPIIELHVTRGISNKQFKSRIGVYVTHRDAAEWWVPSNQRFTARSLGSA